MVKKTRIIHNNITDCIIVSQQVSKITCATDSLGQTGVLKICTSILNILVSKLYLDRQRPFHLLLGIL